VAGTFPTVYTEYRQLSGAAIAAIFPLFLKDSAIDWFDTLSPELKNDLQSLLENFTSYFGKMALDYVFADGTVFSKILRPSEKTHDYISQMQKLAKRVLHLQDEILHWVILRGFRSWIKAGASHRKVKSHPLQHLRICEGRRISWSWQRRRLV